MEGLGRILSLGGRRPSPSFCEGFARAQELTTSQAEACFVTPFPSARRGALANEQQRCCMALPEPSFFVCKPSFVQARDAYKQKKLQQKLKPCNVFVAFAERRGFEPLKHFWRLLTFQASQFNHSCTSPFRSTKVV